MNEDRLVTVKQTKTLSTDLEKKLELRSSDIYEMGNKVKKYKKRIDETYDKMDEFMDKYTAKEREAVEEALRVLREKVEKVKSHETYKSYEKDVELIEQKLNVTMENIFPHYAKAVKRIYASYPEKEERKKKLLEFHEVVGDAFLTKDERKILTIIRSQVKSIPHNVVEIPMIGF